MITVQMIQDVAGCDLLDLKQWFDGFFRWFEQGLILSELEEDHQLWLDLYDEVEDGCEDDPVITSISDVHNAWVWQINGVTEDQWDKQMVGYLRQYKLGLRFGRVLV